MSAFIQATLIIVVAEMGDKTQLVALAFASRFSPILVLSAIFVATLVVHLASVAIGEVLGLALPEFWIAIAAGIAFIGFGIWTFRGDDLDDDETASHSRFGAFATVAVTFFLAELGDKSMLATVTVATQQRQFIPVWLGSTVGMVLADAFAVGVGIIAKRRLPERLICYSAASIFIVTGFGTLVVAFVR